MSEFKRYAIYYAPRDGELSAFAASWLGWDAGRGQSVAHPKLAVPMPISEITASPRKYGFHGTIKPPFVLSEKYSAADLHAALDILTTEFAPISLPGLELTALGRFLALTIDGDSKSLTNLAALTVRKLDPFRAPPTEAELNRRRTKKLTPRQEELLAEWGYPYVMDHFKFHLTLTGKLPKSMVEETRKALGAVLTPLLPKPLIVQDLCLFGEATDGMFHLIERFELSGTGTAPPIA